MNKQEALEITETIQKTVAQMKADDIEECPETAFDTFQCQCCGEDKILAGSILYKDYRLCNDCVLLAELSLALNKITNIEELIEMMDDKRFENVYNSIFNVQENINN